MLIKHNRCGIEGPSSAEKLGRPAYKLVNATARRKLSAFLGAVFFCRDVCPNFGNLEVKTHDKGRNGGAHPSH
jgi:hypothetical protein